MRPKATSPHSAHPLARSPPAGPEESPAAPCRPCCCPHRVGHAQDKPLAATSLTRVGAARLAGQTAITDANIWTAVEECQAESATFDCPASQATYGPIEDWDVGAVTSLNTWGSGCTESAEHNCGRASPIHPDVAWSLRF